MGTEIERKFLVRGNDWRQGRPLRISQGYLNRDKARTVRIRIAESRAYLTIKGPNQGASRSEYEYEIPRHDAEELMALCDGPPLEKNRYTVMHAGATWQIDEFLGANAGLVVAEIELANEEQEFQRPAWVSTEVTLDPRYFNSSLIADPYATWLGNPGRSTGS
jgi:CYTH domain-containing protein